MIAPARRALGLLPLRVRTVLRSLYLPKRLARFVPLELSILERLVLPGDVVLDIGANVGWYTHTLSRLVGPTGHVLAIEPIPSTAWLLRQNARQFGWSNVTILECAVSNVDGETTIRVPVVAGLDEIYEASVDGTSGRAYRVRTCTIDTLAAGRHIAFVKCDVERHEWPVIQGAAQTLRGSHPAWLIELDRNPVTRTGSESQRVAQALAAEAYAPYWAKHGALVPWRSHEWPPSSNFFFLRASQARQAGSKNGHALANGTSTDASK